MVVIYTGDIMRKQVRAEYHVGAVRLTVETAFLSELDSGEIFQRLKRKVEQNERLEAEELMEFIILPLSYREKKEKEEKIQQAVDLAVRIQDREQQLFTLAGILTFTDKLIDSETANKIRRAIEMTQVARIFEEEKQQAIRETRQQAIRETRQQSTREIVSLMIKKGYATDEIISVVPSYSQYDVEELRKGMEEEMLQTV